MTSLNSNTQKIKTGSTAAEALRSLRRGLTRAGGFALYIAVVKTPAQRNQFITLLSEAMPTAKLQTVTITSGANDVLDEIHKQLGSIISGPVMIVGLEDVLSSDTEKHPILNALNLRRPDWPQLVPQPVVLWIPEHLLPILARSTPDFLDWRSDTLHFPDIETAQLQVLRSSIWESGFDTRMSAAARIERIKELEARVTSNEHSRDPVIRSTVANWLNELGAHLFLLGKMQEARNCFEKNLSFSREIGNRRGEGAALGNLGSAYFSLGDTRKSVEFYEQSLAIARETGNRRGESDALGGLGNTYAILGNAHKAIEFYEQSLVMTREIADRRGEGADLGNLGNVYKDLGETRKAIELYGQALTIGREIGDRQGEAHAIGNLGNAYETLGELHKSVEFYEQALAIYRKIGDRRGEGATLNRLGNAFLLLDDAHKALECHEQHLIFAREIGDQRAEGNGLWNSALALDRLGERAKAIARAEAALKIREAIGDPNAAKVRVQLAEWRGQAEPFWIKVG